MRPRGRKDLQNQAAIKAAVIVALILILSGVSWSLLAHADLAEPTRPLNDLWFEMGVSATLVDWFNQVARPNDVAIVGPGALDLLEQITAGRKQVVFTSVAEAEELAPSWADKADMVGYELEQWPTTPIEEQADPVAAVQRLRELAQVHGLELALRPDRHFATAYGAELAPFVDVVTLQAQRLQGDESMLLDFSLPLIHSLRDANPDLSISVQLRSEGSVDQLVNLTHSLQGDIDGISIQYSLATVELAESFVDRLLSDTADAAFTNASGDVVAPASGPSTEPAGPPTPTAAPLPTPASPATQCTWPAGLVLTMSGLVAARARRRRKNADP